MADITVLVHGEVESSGKVNWRGDQISAPIPQSIYKTASVKLGELGSRKVVGDRVFRYALAGGTIAAGELSQGFVDNRLLVTAGGTDPAGGFIFTWHALTTQAADLWAEGMVFSQSGTAANMGHAYRIKSHPVGSASDVALTLYDPLVKALNVTDKWSIVANKYSKITQAAASKPAAGVVPVAVVSGDYFWLQTFGPTSVKCSVNTAGSNFIAGATGQVELPIEATTAGSERAIIGYTVHAHTASQQGLVFLTIAP